MKKRSWHDTDKHSRTERLISCCHLKTNAAVELVARPRRADVELLLQGRQPERSVEAGGLLFAVQTMLRIHVLQQRFGLNDLAMEESLHPDGHFKFL